MKHFLDMYGLLIYKYSNITEFNTLGEFLYLLILYVYNIKSMYFRIYFLKIFYDILKPQWNINKVSIHRTFLGREDGKIVIIL